MNRAARPTATWMVALESVTTAFAWAGLLVWFGSCLVGSFRPDALSLPYWPEVGGPRTDTSGVVAFFVLTAMLALSEALRVMRRSDWAGDWQLGRVSPLTPTSAGLTGLAAAALVAGSGLVVYLSVNAVTHPTTLDIQATHFASWPTEGTLRVVAVVVASLSAGWLRLVTIRHPGTWIGAVAGTPSRSLGAHRETADVP